jgi:hypothetical protein
MSDTSVKDTLDDVRIEHAGNPLVEELLAFITAESSRSLTTPSKV